MNYRIRTIPHSEQKYETAGDYYIVPEPRTFELSNPPGKLVFDTQVRHIVVSEMGNADYEFLVAIHEFVESYLAAKNGITDEAITAFDVEFEKNRKEGNLDEPGDSREAPYRKEHRIATTIEKLMANFLGVNWQNYEDTVNALYQTEKNV